MIRWARLMLSFKYAFEGISYALKNDQNLQIHFIVAAIVFFMGLFYQLNFVELWIISIMILFVLCAEMINTAIEQMVDLIRVEHSREAKIAKDVSAGMVFFAVMASVIVGLVIFIPRIFSL